MFTKASKDDIPVLTPIFSIISLHCAFISVQVIKIPSDWKTKQIVESWMNMHISTPENSNRYKYTKFILPCLFWNILVLELFPRNSCNQTVHQRGTLHYPVFPECFLEDLWKKNCVLMTWFVNLIWTASELSGCLSFIAAFEFMNILNIMKCCEMYN